MNEYLNRINGLGIEGVMVDSGDLTFPVGEYGAVTEALL